MGSEWFVYDDREGNDIYSHLIKQGFVLTLPQLFLTLLLRSEDGFSHYLFFLQEL